MSPPLSLPLLRVLASLGAALLLLGATPREPGWVDVDEAAMREAMEAAAEDDESASAPGYAHFLQARLSHHAGDGRGSLQALCAALASDAGSPLLCTRLAQEHARLGQRALAEQELRAVLELAPSHYEARVLLGRVLLESGRSRAAAQQLRRAVALRPREPAAYLALAQLHLEAHAPERAMAVVEALGAARPDEAEGYRRLGLALAARGDAARASLLLEKAVARAPQDAGSWRVLGGLREAAGKLEAAADAYARVLAREPESREVLLSAGRLALRRGQQAEGLGLLERLLSLSDEPEALLRVAFALVAERAPRAAVQVLDRARAQGERDARVAYYSGLIHEHLQEPELAAAAFAEVAPSAELFHEARLHRAACLAR
ncbi:MAG TPA: tetratricopeptide repeat protein, partial [Aggregicoccus sp.]|nr:tetratricopeptide repeat protein [Aggregicoccus sp.]